MGSYIVNSKEQQLAMLREIGRSDFDEFFRCVPEEVRIGRLDLPSGMSEMETAARMEEIASKNRVFHHIFRGAGSYNHYIPAIVKSVTSKEEFVTAYTPYQPEISQGILQSIFEYQTIICELTGMDVSNASLYDGGTAAAEAAMMCLDRKHHRILVSASADPKVRRVIETYAFGRNIEVKEIPERAGVTDLAALQEMLTKDTAGVYVQQPNFYGNIEDCDEVAAVVHEAGAKLIMGCNPISLAVLKTPAEYGADIAVGEGQPLGLPMGFGGPYLGFMATTKKLMRQMPGRIIGKTTDTEGRDAYVLTLQAREQHIRREKAGSNVCSNEALCALTAGVYVSAMGADGLREVANQCVSKAHYLRDQLIAAGLRARDDQPFFHEFVTVSDVPAEKILAKLEENGILGGLPLDEPADGASNEMNHSRIGTGAAETGSNIGTETPENSDNHSNGNAGAGDNRSNAGNAILWCATEKNTKEEIDRVAALVKEVIGA